MVSTSLLTRTTICLFFVLSCVCASHGWQSPIVRVTGGQVQGRSLNDGGAVFRGIPYAQPPLGDLRWREPTPAKPWTGVRPAAEFSGECAQNSMWGHPKVVNEDCLYLNVWTPTLPPTSLKPVMVWIHGGGNVAGSGRENGGSLARHGVVLVNFNYRLAMFGFFAHPALTAESPRHASGNYGLMDQIAALHWVQENIKEFGGDPSNVTIFGESAGAMDVNLLMTSPLAKGLFRRVIAESGSILLDGGAIPLSTAEHQGIMLVEQAKLPSGAGALEKLRGAPVEQLLDAFAKTVPQGGIPAGLGVDVDGWVLPRPPVEVFAAGKQLPADLIIGINSREFGGSPNASDVKKDIESNYGKLAERALTLYGLTTSQNGTISQGPPDPLYGTSGAQWATDTTFRCPSVVVAQWNSAAHHPTYQYQFDRAAPGKEADGAVHANEVVYVFGNLDEQHPGRPNYQAADYEISRAMQQYWTNFAKTGSPDGNGLPAWPQYQPDTWRYLEFTERGPVAGGGLRHAQCDVFADSMKQKASTAFETAH